MKLKLNEISKSFGPVKANSDINLTVNRGEILGLLGENGAGKTTLFYMIAGLVAIDSGKIYLSGKELNKKSISERNSI